MNKYRIIKEESKGHFVSYYIEFRDLLFGWCRMKNKYFDTLESAKIELDRLRTPITKEVIDY
jgi:hypothetical protein